MSVLQSNQGTSIAPAGDNPVPDTGQTPVPPTWGVKRRFWILPLIVVTAVGALAVGWNMLMGGGAKAPDTLVYYTVRRSTLPITVTERGNLESQNTEEITCEVENFGGDRSGVTGTQILFIVANGCSVKTGDLLVELDSAPLKERLDTQFLALQRAEAERIQAESRFKNQQTQNETNLAEAELRVELTKLGLDSYQDETGGTFQIELQNIEMEVQTARAQQLIAKTNRDAIEQLHKLGYKSKGDYEASKLALLKANSDLASQMARSRQLQDYTYRMEKLDRQGKFDTAQRALTQVTRNNESELAQAKATYDSAKRAYDKEKERYDRYTQQLEKCKIYAPQDGMVAYAMESGRRGGGSVIEEGAFVRQRQKILTIPDLTSMQVSTAVHESVLDQVHKGLKTVVRVDAFPERSYQGSVQSVAVLPDQGGWLASDTKVYKTIVTIDEEVRRLKPGMTAVVEIDVEKLTNIISVPIQAIIQRGASNWCYVNEQGTLARHKVTLGKTNDKFVEIKEGLKEGDIAVLNPTSLVDEELSKREDAEKTAKEGQAGDPDAAATEMPKRTPPVQTPASKGMAGKRPKGKSSMGKSGTSKSGTGRPGAKRRLKQGAATRKEGAGNSAKK